MRRYKALVTQDIRLAEDMLRLEEDRLKTGRGQVKGWQRTGSRLVEDRLKADRGQVKDWQKTG